MKKSISSALTYNWNKYTDMDNQLCFVAVVYVVISAIANGKFDLEIYLRKWFAERKEFLTIQITKAYSNFLISISPLILILTTFQPNQNKIK